MLDRIRVDGLGQSAVHREVGLFVTLQAHRPHGDTPGSRALDDAAHDRLVADLQRLDSPDLDSEDPHWFQNEGIAGPPFASARWYAGRARTRSRKSRILG